MSERSDRERHRQMMELLAELLEMDLAEQREFLEDRCKDDPSLRHALESLIDAAVHADSVLEPVSPSERETETEPHAPPLLAPVQVHGYNIQEKIKSGGMGTVYRAIREDPEQEVALKVIKWGMGTREVLYRFDDERQNLAMMNHSNIAKIFDAGATTDGRPFFVMEYVPGKPITKYCDEQGMSLDERLALFRKVCEGIQHAHQKTVIHRDLKPSNILVATEGDRHVPKIIDFGLAKALTTDLMDRTRPTADAGWVGTPEYVSPEQASSPQTVDTRTDVYSLGVVLYELLTGSLPISSEDIRREGAVGIPSQIERAVVVRPSKKFRSISRSARTSASAVAIARGTDEKTLRRKLIRDLDWIAMKCLEKDPDRRYRSVDDLARDLDRFRAQLPVEAVPPGLGYRVGKFVRRNRTVLAASLVLIALLGFGASQAVSRARATRIAEEQQQELSRQEAAILVEQAQFEVLRDPSTALEMLKLAQDKAPDEVGPALELARIRQLQGRLSEARSSADLLTERFPESGAVRAFWASVYRDERPGDSKAAVNKARELFLAEGVSLRKANSRLAFQMAFGEKDSGLAIAGLNQSIALDEWFFLSRWQRAMRYFKLGQSRRDDGDLNGAAEDFDLSLEDASLMTRVRDEVPQAWVQLGAVQLERSALEDFQSAFQKSNSRAKLEKQAMQTAEDALDALEKAIELDSTDWRAYFNKAITLEHRWKMDKQRWEDLEQSVVDLDQALGKSPEEQKRQIWVAKQRIHNELREFDKAVEAAVEAIALGDSWEIRHRGGSSRKGAGDYPGAVSDFDAALSQLGRDPSLDSDRAKILAARADTLRALSRWDEALRDAVASLRLDRNEPLAHMTLAQVSVQKKDSKTATDHFDHAVRLERANKWAYRLERGAGHWKLGNLDRALVDISEYWRSGEQDAAWLALWAWEIELQRGKTEAARWWLQKAIDPDDKLLVAIGRVFRGEAKPESVPEPGENVRERVYTFYYLGVHAFVEKRYEDAAKWFERCIDLKQYNWVEHGLAEWHLERALEKLS